MQRNGLGFFELDRIECPQRHAIHDQAKLVEIEVKKQNNAEADLTLLSRVFYIRLIFKLLKLLLFSY